MKNGIRTKFTRTLGITLTAAMLFAFAACTGSNQNKKPAQTTDGTDTTAETSVISGTYEESRLPAGLDFGGRTVRILTSGDNEPTYLTDDGALYDNYHAGEITVEDLTSEPVNDAIYNRELYVEDLLNVEIERVETPERDECDNYMRDITTAGDVVCEIVSTDGRGPLVNTQLYVYRNLYDVANLNLDAPWWSQDYEKQSSVAGRLYCATGSLALTVRRLSFVTFFNKKLAEDNGIEGVYDLVFDGKWTIDALTEISSKIYVDTNGNSVKDIEDVFGYMGAPLDTDTLWRSFEISILEKDEDDLFVYSPNLEKFGMAHDKVYKLFDAKTTYCGSDWWGDDGIHELFASDRALFASSKLFRAESDIMRNMQSEYGILPVPKYDEEQKEYHTMPHDIYAAFGIPSLLSSEDADMAGAVLEAMSWYSYRYVVPTYLDVAMKGKYATDPETRRMIDIIDQSICFDSAWIYAYYLNDFPQLWRYLISDMEKNYTSTVTEKDRKIKILLKELNKTFETLAEMT